MNANIFSARDYFNYYFSGIAWLACAFVFYIVEKTTFDLDAVIEIVEKTPISLWLVLLAIIPFMAGFVLSPLGYIVTTFLKKIFGDPVDWALVLKKEKYSESERTFRKRISEPSRSRILEKVSSLQNGEANYSPFFLVRNYVVENAGKNTFTLVNRPLDLANLAESLIIPIPLLSFLVGKAFSSQVLSIALAILFFVILSYRYFKLRGYWVKHNYRAFLILE
jgi:hypothetical protein